jgi:hypothetical protein
VASRRRHFRLGTVTTEASLVLADGPVVAGTALDVGGGGLRLRVRGGAAPVPVGAPCEVHFALLDQSFVLPARVVRRVETEEACELALAWPEAPPSEVDRLIYCLFRIEVGRRGARAPAPPPPPPAARPGTRRREWLLVAALGVAAGSLLPRSPLVPTLLVAALLALWLVLGGA